MQTSPAGARYYCTCNQIKYKTQEPYPQSRNKHVSCLHDNFVYIYAGKDGNISLRDFWKFNIGENRLEFCQHFQIYSSHYFVHLCMHYNM